MVPSPFRREARALGGIGDNGHSHRRGTLSRLRNRLDTQSLLPLVLSATVPRRLVTAAHPFTSSIGFDVIIPIPSLI